MKFLYSAALLTTAATAQKCAAAVVINTVDMTESSTFAEDPTNDVRGGAACPDYYRDQYFRYTATCTGSGLVTVAGNENLARIRAAVFGDPACVVGTPSSTASGANEYVLADMEVCTSPTKQTIDVEPPSTNTTQRFQFIAVTGTEYLIAVGTASSDNATLVGELDYMINVQCAPAASSDIAAPTVITAGVAAYSNVGGIPSTDCTAANNVFFQYEAMCAGNVEFALVPPPSGYDGFHGEDFKIAVYQDAAALGTSTSLACQDDPAIITNNVTAGAVVGPRGGSLTVPSFGAGMVLVVVGSYGSDIAPFMLEVSVMDCPEQSGAAGLVSMAGFTAFLTALYLM